MKKKSQWKTFFLSPCLPPSVRLSVCLSLSLSLSLRNFEISLHFEILLLEGDKNFRGTSQIFKELSFVLSEDLGSSFAQTQKLFAQERPEKHVAHFMNLPLAANAVMRESFRTEPAVHVKCESSF